MQQEVREVHLLHEEALLLTPLIDTAVILGPLLDQLLLQGPHGFPCPTVVPGQRGSVATHLDPLQDLHHGLLLLPRQSQPTPGKRSEPLGGVSPPHPSKAARE